MRVAKMEGALLDLWVARAEGMTEAKIERHGMCTYVDTAFGVNLRALYSPTTLWAQGGPIIERDRISIKQEASGGCYAYFDHRDETAAGATPLVAAMRAYVILKFGEDVEDQPHPP